MKNQQGGKDWLPGEAMGEAPREVMGLAVLDRVERDATVDFRGGKIAGQIIRPAGNGVG